MEKVPHEITLEPEERFIYRCLKLNLTGDDKDALREFIRSGLQWQFIAKICLENHIFPFIYRALRKFDEPDYIPKWIYSMGKREVMITARKNELFASRTRPIFESFNQAGIPYILLRGLMFLEQLYNQDTSIRTFSDIDILILRKNLHETKKLLQSRGFRPVEGAFRDRYYEKHHLHLACFQPESDITFEIHWALDHDYTNYHIDVECIFQGSAKKTVMGIDMLVMQPDDMLITTVVHAFKHYPMIKYFHSYPLLRRSAYQDTQLVRLLDICLILEAMRADLDPERIYRKADDWGVAQPFSAMMHTVKTVFNPDGIDPFLRKDALPRIGRVENLVKNYIFSPEREKKREASSVRKFFFLEVLKYREDLYFNPLRVLDLFAYFFPPRDYFVRKYGRGNFFVVLLRRCQRCLSASAKVIHNLVDLGIYAILRAVEGTGRKKETGEAKV